MTRTTRRLVASFAVVVVAVAATLSIRSLVERSRGVFDPALAQGFFERYVEADGRVVRHDQGGDTVSEGQAYAMLLALALDDEARFRSSWDWAREHLQRDDGLLAWHWAGGKVVDHESASDADVDIAYSLFLAAERFGDTRLREEAEQIAVAILRNETVRGERGRVLVAGPWATEQGVTNVSYFDVRAFDLFARAEPAWRDAAREAERLLASLGDELPTDWSRYAEGRLRPAGGPDDEGGRGSYGFDAARTLVRSAYGSSTTREIAARWWPQARDEAERRDHPVFFVAAAAAAHASGDTGARDALLREATERVHARPTYYGHAWAALGGALLEGNLLAP